MLCPCMPGPGNVRGRRGLHLRPAAPTVQPPGPALLWGLPESRRSGGCSPAGGYQFDNLALGKPSTEPGLGSPAGMLWVHPCCVSPPENPPSHAAMLCRRCREGDVYPPENPHTPPACLCRCCWGTCSRTCPRCPTASCWSGCPTSRSPRRRSRWAMGVCQGDVLGHEAKRMTTSFNRTNKTTLPCTGLVALEAHEHLFLPGTRLPPVPQQLQDFLCCRLHQQSVHPTPTLRPFLRRPPKPWQALFVVIVIA